MKPGGARSHKLGWAGPNPIFIFSTCFLLHQEVSSSFLPCTGPGTPLLPPRCRLMPPPTSPAPVPPQRTNRIDAGATCFFLPREDFTLPLAFHSHSRFPFCFSLTIFNLIGLTGHQCCAIGERNISTKTTETCKSEPVSHAIVT